MTSVITILMLNYSLFCTFILSCFNNFLKRESKIFFFIYLHIIKFTNFNLRNISDLVKTYTDADFEFEQQNIYLSSFGLQWNPITSNENCLFRSISFSRYGHQNIHQELRNLAVEIFRGNMYNFQNYFLDDACTPQMRK